MKPVAYDLAWFARDFRSQPQALEDLRAFSPKYRVHRKPKARGGYRRIAVPHPDIARMQRRILDGLLAPFTEGLGCVYGAIPGGGPLRHARVHRRATTALIMDIKDAFGHGTPERVREALTRVGRHRPNLPPLADDLRNWLVDLTTDPALGLPQGAPTSNALFNLLCHPLDVSLSRLARERGLRYTRYVDELVLSGRRDVETQERDEMARRVAEHGFRLHQRKTRLFRLHQGALHITGVSVCEGEQIRLSKRKMEAYRNLLHRAQFDPFITIHMVEGVMGHVRHVYRGDIPPRLAQAYQRVVRAKFEQDPLYRKRVERSFRMQD